MSGFIVVIPARYASERLPGKVLRELGGRPMLRHVYDRATESSAADVVIAADDDRVAECARGFGADVCMTSREHRSGTDRIAEVARIRSWASDQAVVNLQGDEPFMLPELIDQCAALLDDPEADIGTLGTQLDDADAYADPNVVKVVTDARDFAIYFSRAAIPYARTEDTAHLALTTAMHHLGMYGYRAATLQRFVSAAPSDLETCEQLEQLRALSIGMRIKVGRAAVSPGPGIDTEADLRTAEELLSSGYLR